MKISEFTYDLPERLIAQTPAERRGGDRLLLINRKTGEYKDSMFSEFTKYVDDNSLIVINDTRVRKARVYGVAETGGKVEFLFTGSTGEPKDGKSSWQAMVSKSKKQKVGKSYSFFDNNGKLYCHGTIASDVNDDDTGSSLKIVEFDRIIDENFFLECGHVPLPPYIKREDDFNDEKRYQTVYAKNYGSMAAPTAGLHFTDDTLKELKERGIEIVHVTLQVGMGTFLPVRTENLEDHVMHTEAYIVTDEAAEIINKAKAEGKKIVAIGTTSVRTLESAYDENCGKVKSGSAETALFIKPGFQFHVVDQLVTNFHTPESTLLVLVSAFAGRENVLNAYKHAVEEEYRFFSYGDATFFY
ncbi:MAG: tRNA preQ1(34) S-adenosylmethionine ribosyltransferase-isomerase QueA [Sphaerochaetaceae bacterium]|nr:tRNA preQ1(34) S-adenosylmethionine ribosyltransferase-isomerase QueA [Sphaerochaetaceae bacterium]